VVNHSEIKKISFSESESFIRQNFLGASKEEDIDSFLNIFKKMADENCIEITAFFLHGKIINTIITYIDDCTAALLGTFNDKEYVKISGASVLIDHAIKENIGNRIFDFEGGEIPNVEEFFRGFRPELRPYRLIEYSKKELIRKMIRLKFIIKS